jgi:predicted transcriptional regulator
MKDNNVQDVIKPARSNSLANALRNPLVVFGLVLLAGDGPLVIAYVLTKDATRSWVLLIAMILFIFSMGAFFAYLVAFKPRHLYAPTEIPEKAFGKSIYQDPEPVKRILKDAQNIAANIKDTQNDSERNSLTQNLKEKLRSASHLQLAYDLLLIPGYDLSLISDILESFERTGTIEPEIIAHNRHITPSTIITITNSMNARGLLEPKGQRLTLTKQGQDMLESLREYLRPLQSL